MTSFEPLTTNTVTFHATWDKVPSSQLKHKFKKRVLQSTLHKYIGSLVVPASLIKFKSMADFKKGLHSIANFYELKLHTPDGVCLDGVFIPTNNFSNKTIIYFNCNGVPYEWLIGCQQFKLATKTNFTAKTFLNVPFSNLSNFIDAGYNIVLFNYRGVSGSNGYPTRRGLHLDAETVYQYVHLNLEIQNEDILLYGHSLGGGIATRLAYLHPGVSICSDRSFSTLSGVVESRSPIFGSVFAELFKSIDWEMNNLALWDQIKGKKCVIYHRKDEMIFSRASLKSALSKRFTNTKFVELDTEKFDRYLQKIFIDQFNKPIYPSDQQKITRIAKKSSHIRSLAPAEIEEVLNFFEKEAK